MRVLMLTSPSTRLQLEQRKCPFSQVTPPLTSFFFPHTSQVLSGMAVSFHWVVYASRKREIDEFVLDLGGIQHK